VGAASGDWFARWRRKSEKGEDAWLAGLIMRERKQVTAARASASFGGEQVEMEGGQMQESKEVCGLNRRRRRIRHGT
jgi:hypothetical protein